MTNLLGTRTTEADSGSRAGARPSRDPAGPGALRLAMATRSMTEVLGAAAHELVAPHCFGPDPNLAIRCHVLTGTDSLGYFRALTQLDADWVVNLDEDAYLLDPTELVALVRHLEANGYAACGMPDGGVVRIRRHNPVACNAFFNVFDLRRVRRVWQNWDSVRAATHRPAYEAGAPEFTRRTRFAYDHFERYYGVFFALLNAGERILYLDAEEWSDGVSTLLKSHARRPLLLHCWYTRNWPHSYHTRRRFREALTFARQAQGLGATEGLATAPEPDDLARPGSNLGKWDGLYRDAAQAHPYGDTLTYRKAARYLAGMESVEDWGCGCAWLKRYLPGDVRYRGLDGSASPFADAVSDLATHRSGADGIVLRHVLEHNSTWSAILANAVRSCRKRLVLILFTPFAEATGPINQNAALGVPDLAFAKADLVRHFAHLRWSLEENIPTNTQYGIEHVFYVDKS